MRAIKSRSVPIVCLLLCAAGCASDAATDDQVAGQQALLERAYVVNELSDELSVIDLRDLSLIASVATEGVGNHMAAVSEDGGEVFISSGSTDEIIVVDARGLEVTDRIEVGYHPTHINVTPDGGLLAVMEEDQGDNGAVSFIDIERHELLDRRITDVATPHFVRFSSDGKTGYIANIRGTFVTQFDVETLQVRERIGFEGLELGALESEGGFGDAQIDASGVMYAAHNATGRVLVYDTEAEQVMRELTVGDQPWVAFTEHPFRDIAHRYLVPNLGDRTLSLIDGDAREVVRQDIEGDEEVYGVNFSSRTPEHAFVMMRTGSRIAVVDMMSGQVEESIELDGNVETASTTPDGRYIVAAVSSAGSVAVIDTESREVVKVFEEVGDYPWSVVIPGGQNYCH